jgi:hypothetical protein
MKSILSFYANLLLKLSLTQSILITTFISWIQCLWGGVHCQHMPPSVSGSSASLVATWEKLLALLPWCSVSNSPLSLVSFRTPCFWDILRDGSVATRDARSVEQCRRNILRVTTTESLFLKYVSTVKARCSTDQRSVATEILWVSLEERLRTNSPRQSFHPLTTVLQNCQVFLPDPILYWEWGRFKLWMVPIVRNLSIIKASIFKHFPYY